MPRLFSAPSQWTTILQWTLDVPQASQLGEVWVDVWRHPELRGVWSQGLLEQGVDDRQEPDRTTWNWSAKTEIYRGATLGVGSEAVECASWVEPTEVGYRFCFAVPMTPLSAGMPEAKRATLEAWMETFAVLSETHPGTIWRGVQSTLWQHRTEFSLDPRAWTEGTEQTQALRSCLTFSEALCPAMDGLTVDLPSGLQTAQAVFERYGACIYDGQRQHLNPIFEDSSYFGRNFNAFWDCLRCVYPNVLTHLRVNHHGVTQVTPDERVMYLGVLLDLAAELRMKGLGTLEVVFHPSMRDVVEQDLLQLEKQRVWRAFEFWGPDDIA
ncbi:barstar family protein [Deinococcus multiflagellatus]|uniref:Barstar family protein n=1 Tax=Deinococcus multiflagellatus TaxID=1656887 RepID=A0ABW1ZN59_9DEIO|nr:barstar family protein [Deinococcus multiflagellatus]MBZ9715720.1 barstar family protein [Deinococcus multiflagellatus]